MYRFKVIAATLFTAPLCLAVVFAIFLILGKPLFPYSTDSLAISVVESALSALFYIGAYLFILIMYYSRLWTVLCAVPFICFIYFLSKPTKKSALWFYGAYNVMLMLPGFFLFLDMYFLGLEGRLDIYDKLYEMIVYFYDRLIYG